MTQKYVPAFTKKFGDKVISGCAECPYIQYWSNYGSDEDDLYCKHPDGKGLEFPSCRVFDDNTMIHPQCPLASEIPTKSPAQNSIVWLSEHLEKVYVQDGYLIVGVIDGKEEVLADVGFSMSFRLNDILIILNAFLKENGNEN